MKKLLSNLLPHFDKADTLYRVVTIAYKVACLIRDELASLTTGNNQPPPAAGLALS